MKAVILDTSKGRATVNDLKKLLSEKNYTIESFDSKEMAIKSIIEHNYDLIFIACLSELEQASIADDFIHMVRFCGLPDKSKLPIVLGIALNEFNDHPSLASHSVLAHRSVVILSLPANVKSLKNSITKALKLATASERTIKKNQIAEKSSIGKQSLIRRKSNIPIITTHHLDQSNNDLEPPFSDNVSQRNKAKLKSRVNIPTIASHSVEESVKSILPNEKSDADNEKQPQGEGFLKSNSADEYIAGDDIKGQHFCADEIALESGVAQSSSIKKTKSIDLKNSNNRQIKIHKKTNKQNIRKTKPINESITDSQKKPLVIANKSIIVVFFLVLMAFAVFFDEFSQSSEPIKIIVVKQKPIVNLLSLPGEIVSKNNIELLSPESGTIESILIREGDEVQKGQILLKLDSADIDVDLNQIGIQINILKKDIESEKMVLNKLEKALTLGAVSRNTVEQSHLELELIEKKQDLFLAERKELLIKKNSLTVKAPFSGLIVKVDVKKGQWVIPQDKLLSLLDPKSKEVKFDTNKLTSKPFKVGQEIIIHLTDNNSTLWREKISRIKDESDFPDSETVFFTSLATNKLTYDIGTKVRAEIKTYSSSRSLVIPQYVVQKKDGQSLVAVNLNGRVHYIAVETGIRDGVYIEILSGLSLGQEVLDFQNEWLAEGVKISQEGLGRY